LVWLHGTCRAVAGAGALTGRLSERIALGQEHAPLIHSFTHSLSPSHLHSPTHPLTHSPTHSTHPLTMAAAACRHDNNHRNPPDRASPAATAQLGSRTRASWRLPGLFSPSASPPPSQLTTHCPDGCTALCTLHAARCTLHAARCTLPLLRLHRLMRPFRFQPGALHPRPFHLLFMQPVRLPSNTQHLVSNIHTTPAARPPGFMSRLPEDYQFVCLLLHLP
jgi:hypothetical protein